MNEDLNKIYQVDEKVLRGYFNGKISEILKIPQESVNMASFGKISKNLKVAYKMCRDVLDYDRFVRLYYKEMQKIDKVNNDRNKLNHIKKEVKKNIKNIKYKFFICEEDDDDKNHNLFLGLESKKLKYSTGWITSGEYNGEEYRYYTNKKEDGLSSLINFIANEQIKPNGDAEFDAILDFLMK